MKRISFVICALSCFCISLLGQSTYISSGTERQWLENTAWNTGSYPGSNSPSSYTVQSGDDELRIDEETITVTNYVQVGDDIGNVGAVNTTFLNTNSRGSLTLEQGDTLVFYGDVLFQNKSLELNIESNAFLIILGNLTFDNIINIASGGQICVLGTLTKLSSSNGWSGAGRVYASAYGGKADDWIPGDLETSEDQQQTFEELIDDGYEPIYNFMMGVSLPVDLVSFDSNVNDNSVEIIWKTASELNNDYFSVQRSENGHGFYQLGTVKGNGTTKIPQYYFFIDSSPISHLEYYRLVQFDFDGSATIHRTILTYLTGLEHMDPIQIQPNPARSELFIFSNSQHEITDLFLKDLQGKVVLSSQLRKEEVGSIIRLSLPELEPGLYILHYVTLDNKMAQEKYLSDKSLAWIGYGLV